MTQCSSRVRGIERVEHLADLFVECRYDAHVVGDEALVFHLVRVAGEILRGRAAFFFRVCGVVNRELLGREIRWIRSLSSD